MATLPGGKMWKNQYGSICIICSLLLLDKRMLSNGGAEGSVLRNEGCPRAWFLMWTGGQLFEFVKIKQFGRI
jgi:hypothetical protein